MAFSADILEAQSAASNTQVTLDDLAYEGNGTAQPLHEQPSAQASPVAAFHIACRTGVAGASHGSPHGSLSSVTRALRASPPPSLTKACCRRSTSAASKVLILALTACSNWARPPAVLRRTSICSPSICTGRHGGHPKEAWPGATAWIQPAVSLPRLRLCLPSICTGQP